MDVSLRTLRAFLAVVEAGTFTEAAARLGTSQPAISRAVASLEAGLGTSLIARGPRAIELTDAGRRALPIARRLLADAVEFETVRESAKVLRLGYTWAGLGWHTTALEERWRRARPDVDLVLVNSMTATGGIIEGRADAAVVRTPVNDPRLGVITVGHERRYAAVPVSDPLARRRAVRLEDFSGHSVAFEPTTGTTKPELWPDARHAPRMHVVHGMQEWLQAVTSGRALGLTTEATVWQFPHSDIRYKPVTDLPDVELRLVWYRDAPPALLDELIDLLRVEFTTGRPGERA